MAAFSISPANLALVTSCIAVVGLITTYVLYVFVEKQGPAWLPMLSDTFVPVPGNYISRIMLSVSALNMGIIGLAPYFDAALNGYGALPRKLLLGASTVASIALGCVGAVCESTHVPTCMGNTDVHDVTAVVFFVCYDIYMIANSWPSLCGRSAATRTTRTRGDAFRRVVLVACVLVSLLSKLRYAPPALIAYLLAPAHADDDALSAALGAAASTRLSAAGGPPYLAVGEYTDVTAIFIWMSTYMQTIGANYEYGLVVPKSKAAPTAAKTAPKGIAPAMQEELLTTSVTSSVTSTPAIYDPTPLAALSVSGLADLTLALAMATVGTTFAISWKLGAIDPISAWPMISDTFVIQPCNMISRYTVCLGGTLLGFGIYGHYASVRPARPTRTSLQIGTVIGIVGACGLVGVGAINEKEDITLHSGCAITFFGGLLFWAALDHYSSTGAAGRPPDPTRPILPPSLAPPPTLTKPWRSLGEALAKPWRSLAEALPKPCRSLAEALPKPWRSLAEALAKP